jgi:hypothetical protein
MPGQFSRRSHFSLRRVPILLVFLAAVISGCASTPSDIVMQKGFRDITWGMPMDDLANLTPLEKGGGRWTWAFRDPERLTIGSVDVDSISYIFIDNAFAGIDAGYSGIDRFSQLIRELEKTIGPPTLVNKKMNMLAWKKDQATVMLRFYRMQNNGSLKYTNDELTTQ